MAGSSRFRIRGRRIRFIWLLVALLAAFVVFLEVVVDFGGQAQGPAPNPRTISFPENDDRLVQAQVLAVIDGDTIEVELEGPAPVRYYGSDAPERGDACAAEATQRNRQLVETKTVFLLPDARDKDEGGRLLRYVFTEEGLLLDALLISEGLATAWREDGTYQGELVNIEQSAAANGVGCLWSH